MSSTITVSRRASAFRSPSGTIFYALWENTCESNVYPHTPHESCAAFGTITQVMAWIYGAMESCAGGMLRGRSSALTPLGYLRSWQSALDNPIQLSDRDIVLKASDSWRASVPTGGTSEYDPDRLALVAGKLRAMGYHAQAEQLEAGAEVRLRLHHDGDVLVSIYGYAADGIAPWRVLEPYGLNSAVVQPALAPPKPTAKGVVVPPITAYRIEKSAEQNTGFWVCALVEGYGSVTDDSFFMASFISQVASKCEAACPGAGKLAIRAMQQVLHTPIPLAPDTLRVFIDRPDTTPRQNYRRAAFDAVATGLGTRATLTDACLETTVAALRATGLQGNAMSAGCRKPRFEEGLVAEVAVLDPVVDLFDKVA